MNKNKDNNKSIFDSLKIYNPDEAFENAIKKGMNDPENWMYMYSSNIRDYFKHCDTRKYISYLNFKNIKRGISKELSR